METQVGKTFVEKMQEMARESLCTYDSYDNTRTYQAVPEQDLDTLIAHTIKNTLEEVGRRLEEANLLEEAMDEGCGEPEYFLGMNRVLHKVKSLLAEMVPEE